MLQLLNRALPLDWGHRMSIKISTSHIASPGPPGFAFLNLRLLACFTLGSSIIWAEQPYDTLGPRVIGILLAGFLNLMVLNTLCLLYKKDAIKRVLEMKLPYCPVFGGFACMAFAFGILARSLFTIHGSISSLDLELGTFAISFLAIVWLLFVLIAYKAFANILRWIKFAAILGAAIISFSVFYASFCLGGSATSIIGKDFRFDLIFFGRILRGVGIGLGSFAFGYMIDPPFADIYKASSASIGLSAIFTSLSVSLINIVSHIVMHHFPYHVGVSIFSSINSLCLCLFCCHVIEECYQWVSPFLIQVTSNRNVFFRYSFVRYSYFTFLALSIFLFFKRQTHPIFGSCLITLSLFSGGTLLLVCPYYHLTEYLKNRTRKIGKLRSFLNLSLVTISLSLTVAAFFGFHSPIRSYLFIVTRDVLLAFTGISLAIVLLNIFLMLISVLIEKKLKSHGSLPSPFPHAREDQKIFGPVIVMAPILLVNVVIFAWSSSGLYFPQGFQQYLSLSYRSGPVSYLSHIFMHNSLLHLLLNCLSIFLLGRPCLEVMRPLQFYAFYLSAGIAAGLSCQLERYSYPFPAAGVGASGAIMALFGVLARTDSVRSQHLLPTISASSLLFLYVLWDILGIFWGGVSPVNHHCHLTGAAFGILLYPAFDFFWRNKDQYFEWA